ncbi:MAG: hypothetical protein IJM30_07685 [Thermoguttaceae bacterium]|nr:hypothetical protein [Thermoguttaceae bacterium]
MKETNYEGARTNPRSDGAEFYALRPLEDQYHPTISTTNVFEGGYERYLYLQEQLALNAERSGSNLVNPKRTRHILRGYPILKTERSRFDDGWTTVVGGWSGGHANPDAAKYGKTQIPSFWTTDRFMYEVSDILADDSSRWYRQEGDDFGQKQAEASDKPERYVCVEERYGVPIRVVAERVDDSLKCVTAFPDYTSLELDESLRVAPGEFSELTKGEPRRRTKGQ